MRAALAVGLALPAVVQSQPGPRPGPSPNCTDPSYGPVLAGLDFVDLLLNKKEGADAPDFGTSDNTATLNGYTFWFKSSANAETFKADPWAYAPMNGGF